MKLNWRTRSNRQERVEHLLYERNRPAFIRYLMVTIPCLTGCYGKKKNYMVVYKKQAESVQVKYILMRVPIENGSGNLPGIILDRALCRLLFLGYKKYIKNLTSVFQICRRFFPHHRQKHDKCSFLFLNR